MDVVDAIAAVPTFNGVSGFDGFPLQNYTVGDPVVSVNYVIVTEITVIDPIVDTAAGLNPTATTRNTGGGNGGGGGGGGSFGLLAIFGLLVLGRRRYGLLKTA